MPPKRKRKGYRKLFKRPPKGHKHYGALKATEDIPEEPRVFVEADMQISWSSKKKTCSPTESPSANCELPMDQDSCRTFEIHNMDSNPTLDDLNEIQGINVFSEIPNTMCASDINYCVLDLSSIAENENDGTLLKEVQRCTFHSL